MLIQEDYKDEEVEKKEPIRELALPKKAQKHKSKCFILSGL